jgi:SAM-dependent methyltransferase
VREELLDVLADPQTGAELQLEDARRRDGRIEEGTLRSATGNRYPIIRGIPRFVSADNYSASFGMQWNRFRDSQVDSLTGARHSEQRFDAELGWSASDLDGQWVMDAGCGAGRFAEIAARRGARLVALDYSSAVDAAAETLRQYPHADVVQGNILEPPFRPGAFAFAYSIGVIQHTPEPARAIDRVVRCVTPGGRFGFTIYGRRPWTKLCGKYLLRPITRRLPSPVLLSLIERTMPVLFPITDRLFRVPVLGKVASFAIPVANYVDNAQFSREQRYREAILDTFDSLSPRYDSPMTWQEVERSLTGAQAARWAFQQRIPVNVVGER